MAYTYAGEPVTIETIVRRGDKMVLKVGHPINGPSGWYSFTADHDIVTQNGNLCAIQVLCSTREMQNKRYPAYAEEDKLPTHELSPEERTFLEGYIPF